MRERPTAAQRQALQFCAPRSSAYERRQLQQCGGSGRAKAEPSQDQQAYQRSQSRAWRRSEGYRPHQPLTRAPQRSVPTPCDARAARFRHDQEIECDPSLRAYLSLRLFDSRSWLGRCSLGRCRLSHSSIGPRSAQRPRSRSWVYSFCRRNWQDPSFLFPLTLGFRMETLIASQSLQSVRNFFG